MSRRPWSEDEDELITHCYKTPEYPVGVLANVMQRSRSSVYQRAKTLGLTDAQVYVPDDVVRQAIEDKHPLGWSDAEIARHVAEQHGCGVDRHRLGKMRRTMGLSSNNHSEHQRKRIAAKTTEQLKAAGLPSIGHLRKSAFDKWKRELGWPESLTLRAVQALELLWERGPMTRLGLCEAMGIDREHAIANRTEPKSNAKGGTALAELQRAGLVMRLPKQVKSGTDRRGGVRRVDLYLLSPGVEPNGQRIKASGCRVDGRSRDRDCELAVGSQDGDL
ncbi:MAG: hypothetical protein AAFV88_25045 [Planctomycetota bacterium]